LKHTQKFFKKNFVRRNSFQGPSAQENSFQKNFSKSNFAQGTIEYLVIIAIVVVIGLVVISLLLGLVSSNSGTDAKADKIKQYTQPALVKAVDGLVDVNDGVLIIKNDNASGSITLKGIIVSDPNSIGTTISNTYSDSITFSNKVNISVDGFAQACPCSADQKSRECRVTINYLDNYGLDRNETAVIPVDCVSAIQVSDPNSLIQPDTGAAGPVPPDCFYGLNDGNLCPKSGVEYSCSSASPSVDTNWSYDSNLSDLGACEWSCASGYVYDSGSCRAATCLNGLNGGSSCPYSSATYSCSSATPTVDTNWAYDSNLSGLGACEWSCASGFTYDAISGTCQGIGTLASPWLISSCQNLQDMNTHLDGNYKLDSNVNCSGFTFKAIDFNGSLDCDNKGISNLKVTTPSNNGFLGLFGLLKGNVSNCSITDGNIYSTTTDYVGGLAGKVLLATITNSSFGGVVRGRSYVGGLIGSTTGKIINSFSTATLTASSSYVGGLVGYTDGNVTTSYATGNVTGSASSTYLGGLIGYTTAHVVNSYAIGTVVNSAAYTGGLAGYATNATMSGSHANGNVTSNSQYTGGLIGYCYANNVTTSYATGNVSGSWDVGGLLGYGRGYHANNYAIGSVTGLGRVGGLVGWLDLSSYVNYSYATGRVDGAQYSGGLVGSIKSTVYNSYALGTVVQSMVAGGLIGEVNGGGASNLYWDTTLSGKANCFPASSGGCTSTANNAAAYYGASGIPFANLSFPTTYWQSVDGNNPTLK
jgi:hypothetical protein